MAAPIELRNLVLGAHPLARLTALHALREETDAMFDELELQLVHVCRRMPRELRPTFDEIGAALGVAKSNAKRRYDRWLDERAPVPLEVGPIWEDPIYAEDLDALRELEAEGRIGPVWLERLRAQLVQESMERYEATA